MIWGEGYYIFFKIIILIKQMARDIARAFFFLESVIGNMWLKVCVFHGTGFDIPDLICNIRERTSWESGQCFL